MSLLKGVTGFVEVDNISQKCRAMNLKIKSLAYGVSLTVAMLGLVFNLPCIICRWPVSGARE